MTMFLSRSVPHGRNGVTGKTVPGLILWALLCACAGTGGGLPGGDDSAELARRLRTEGAMANPAFRESGVPDLSGEKKPADGEALVLARALMVRGFYDIALAQLEAPDAGEPVSAERHCLKGRCLREKREWDRAAAEFEAALVQCPDMAPAHAGLGMIAAMKGDSASAVRYFEEAVRRNPASAAFLNNLAVALMAENRGEEAIGPLRRAIAIAPDFRRAWNNLGLAHALSGRDEEALAAFRAGGDEAAALANLVFVHWRTGREEADAKGERHEEETGRHEAHAP